VSGIISVIERQFSVFVGFVLVALTALLYQHALHSGFFLDDSTSIRVEPLMLQSEILPLYEKFKLRFLGYLSFWANYQISGENPASFRLVNFLIHGTNGVLVYLLSHRMLSLADDTSDGGARLKWAALLVAVLFVVHPLQTQAVTYIVQRLASLVALFYLAALLFWVEAYRCRSPLPRLGWMSLCFISVVAACCTKQNAFTLPAVFLLMEVLIFRRVTLKQCWVFGFLATVLFVGAALTAPDLLASIDGLTRETPDITRWEYFTHQWVVLWMYLGKVVWPYPQLLDYGIELHSFSVSTMVLSALGHFLVLTLAGITLRKMPAVAFGVLFFYVSHSVESGFIPIRDLAFEHRNYLPLFGVFLAFGAALVAVEQRAPAAVKHTKWLAIAIVVFFAQATWARNQMWADQEALLKHDVLHNEGNVRALYNLALWYQRNDSYDESIDTMKALVQANDGQLSLLHATTYVATLIDLQLYDLALNLLDKLLRVDMRPRSRATFLRQLGTVLTAKAEDEVAAAKFEEAMRFSPLDYDSGLAYGYSLIQLGRLIEAETLIRQLNSRFGNRTRLKMLEDVLRAKALQLSEPKLQIDEVD
jgi:hypothetical protein